MTVRAPFAAPLDLSNVDQRFLDRFWSKVDRRGPDECWPWLAHRKASGYGQFVLRNGEYPTASRVALALTVGPLAAGVVACHTCDNPPCCNPAHLFPGTQADNTSDSVSKGRANRAHGPATGSARLTEDQVAEIRAEPHHYGLTAMLARRYGVSATTIRKIRRGEKWGHLDIPTNPAELCTKGHLLAGDNRLPVKDRTARTLCATCAEAFRVSRLVGSRRDRSA